MPELRVNDKITIKCEPFEVTETATVLSVASIDFEDGNFIQSGDLNNSQTIVVAVVKLDESDRYESLMAVDCGEADWEQWDWRFPSRAPSDVKIKVKD